MDAEQKRRKRSSEKQLDHMVEFMINHKQFACGKFQGMKGKKYLHDMWERLSEELNEIGPKKSSEQWKKVICN